MRELMAAEIDMVSGGSIWTDITKWIGNLFKIDPSKVAMNPCPTGMNYSLTTGGRSMTVHRYGAGPEGLVNLDIQYTGSNYTQHVTCTVPTQGSGPGGAGVKP